MAIVNYRPDESPRPLSTPDTIKEAPGSNFTALVPPARVKELIKYVEGHPWTTNYYGILKRKNNTLENFDPKAIHNTQSYYKVNNLILQVSSPLSSSYDETTGITTITGSALAPLGLKPNVSDVFLANVDSGEDAWFNVTSVERRTFTKETVYEINYKLEVYVSQDRSYGEVLEKRVNSEYHFNKDTNFFNRDLLITTEEHEARESLNRWLHMSTEYYLDMFCSDKAGTLMIPSATSGYYDPLLLKFIRRTVPGDYLIDKKIYQYEHFDRYIEQKSIYDIFTTKNISLLRSINKDYGFVPTGSIANRARFGTIGHSEINYLLYPINPDQTRYVDTKEPKSAGSRVNNPLTNANYYIDSTLVTKTSNNDEEYTVPVLHELFDGAYVVSGEFYEQLENPGGSFNLSYIEILLLRYVKGEAISKPDIWTAVKDYDRWSLLHQFYLLPVMWHVARYHV